MKKKKILITGSSGMLGSDLCKAFSGAFYTIGVDVVPPKQESLNPDIFITGDISDKAQIDKITADDNFDYIIHTAAWTDVDGCEKDEEKALKINVKGTEHLIDIASKKKCPVIFLSTDYVFDGRKKKPYIPTDIMNPLNVYGKTKMTAENIVKENASEFLIIRTSWLFGKNGRNFIEAISKKAEVTDEIRVVNDQEASPTYTKDLAGAIKRVLSLESFPRCETIHITNEGVCSWFDLAKTVLEMMGLAKTTIVDPISSGELARPAKRPVFSALDNEAYESISGSSLPPWKEAVKEYINEKGQ